MWGMAWTWPRSTSFVVSDQRKVRSVGHWYHLYSQKFPKDDYVEILINTKILILACTTVQCTTGITKKQGDRELLM